MKYLGNISIIWSDWQFMKAVLGLWSTTPLSTTHIWRHDILKHGKAAKRQHQTESTNLNSIRKFPWIEGKVFIVNMSLSLFTLALSRYHTHHGRRSSWPSTFFDLLHYVARRSFSVHNLLPWMVTSFVSAFLLLSCLESFLSLRFIPILFPYGMTYKHYLHFSEVCPQRSSCICYLEYFLIVDMPYPRYSWHASKKLHFWSFDPLPHRRR